MAHPHTRDARAAERKQAVAVPPARQTRRRCCRARKSFQCDIAPFLRAWQNEKRLDRKDQALVLLAVVCRWPGGVASPSRPAVVEPSAFRPARAWRARGGGRWLHRELDRVQEREGHRLPIRARRAKNRAPYDTGCHLAEFRVRGLNDFDARGVYPPRLQHARPDHYLSRDLLVPQERWIAACERPAHFPRVQQHWSRRGRISRKDFLNGGRHPCGGRIGGGAQLRPTFLGTRLPGLNRRADQQRGQSSWST